MNMIDRWEDILNAYRDANQLFGNVVKVTPSSKCVGDLALYLVNRNISASELMNTPSLALKLDFPESTLALMKGDLGVPHRGFPNGKYALYSSSVGM